MRDVSFNDRNVDADAPQDVAGSTSIPPQAPVNPKVIPIPMLTPSRPPHRRAPGTNGRTGRRIDISQQTLNFTDAGSAERFDVKVEAVIYCDAPVATPAHRLMATSVDAAWIVLGMCGFALMYFGALAYWKIPAPVLQKQNLMMLGAAFAIIAVFYKLLWANANGDSTGMRFARLRLVNFDGRIPNRKQRLIRQVASVVSVMALGCGLLWALVDEENLTWHDHISKTFPTPG